MSHKVENRTMSDLIKSFSQTPLPTIMVVAGILFLFVSIGGQLGAWLATDSIKRNFSGVLGLILLVGGISLYVAGQLYHQNPKDLALPEISHENAYQLRANSIPSGRIIENRSQFNMSGATLTLQNDEEFVTGKIGIESSDLNRLEILSSSGGRPTILEKTILSDVTKTTTHIAGNTETNTENGVLQGQSIQIKQQNGRWVKRLLGAEPTEAQQIELKEPYENDYENYPAGLVKVGTTWTLDGPLLAYIAGLENLLSVDGSASMTFKKVTDCGEDKCAVISLNRMEVHGETLVNGNVAQFKIGGYGTVKRSLSKFIDNSFLFEGTMKIEFETLSNGKRIRAIIVGPVKMNGSAKIISE